MNIGSVKLDNNVFLAPMAGITDRAFRILCKEQGCGLTYTEMVSAKGLHYENKRTENLLSLRSEDRPVAVSLSVATGITGGASGKTMRKGRRYHRHKYGLPHPENCEKRGRLCPYAKTRAGRGNSKKGIPLH